MPEAEDLQPALRRRADEISGRLPPSEREALLVKSWMSHDARWFGAVAAEYGMHAANRLNRIAVRETGRAEARRIVRALELPRASSIDDYLLAQEAIIGLVGPRLLDYRVVKLAENACRIEVRRCFAHENVARTGVAEQYDCGIFPRVAGWLDALGLPHRITPCPERCLAAQGAECAYRISLEGAEPLEASPARDAPG